MKNLVYVFILALTFISCDKTSEVPCISYESAGPDCIDTSLINPTANCPDNYDPVCGCNGVTYGNACDAHINGVLSYTEGECCY